MNPTSDPRAGDNAPPPELAGAFAQLRIDLAGAHAPPAVWVRARGAALQATMPHAPSAAVAGVRPAVAWPTLAAGMAGMAALLLVWCVGPGHQPSVRTPVAAPDMGAGPVGRVPRASGFVPVASPERFAELWQGGAQAAPAWVVRAELPRERLAALGLPYDPARAGKIGNEKPIQIVREVWTSPELLLTVQSRDADPRSAERTYRLTNLKRGEPDAALMKVPADYAASGAAAMPSVPATPGAPATPGTRRPAASGSTPKG